MNDKSRLQGERIRLRVDALNEKIAAEQGEREMKRFSTRLFSANKRTQALLQASNLWVSSTLRSSYRHGVTDLSR